MDINRLTYFLSAAKHLNFTRAANECYIAQTAMSRHILALEEELCVTLFQRNNRSVTLTPAGEAFYDEAQVILAKLQKAIDSTQLIDQGYQGTIGIGFGPYERPLMAETLRRFSQAYPNVEVVCRQHTFKSMIELLGRGLLDVIYSMGQSPMVISEAISKPIPGTNELRLVVAADHPLAQKGSVSVEELEGMEFIYNGELGGPAPTAHFMEVCAQFGFRPGRLLATNSLAGKLIMVQSGNKACLVPAFRADTLGSAVSVLHMPAPRQPIEPCYASYIASNTNPTAKIFFDMI